METDASDRLKLKISIDNSNIESDDECNNETSLRSDDYESDDDVEFNVRLDQHISFKLNQNIESNEPISVEREVNEIVTVDEDSASDGVEINVHLGNIETNKKNGDISEKSENLDKISLPSKIYINKAGDFITGLDQLDDDVIKQKRIHRSKRFGIEPNSETTFVDRSYIYKSLNMTEEQLTDEKIGYRLNTIHLRGVDRMSTDEVFHYFREFPASKIEWINDTACNVVWEDASSCVRAMFKLSRDKKELDNLITLATKVSEDSTTSKPTETNPQPIEDDEEKGKPENVDDVPDDYDELDLEVDNEEKHLSIGGHTNDDRYLETVSEKTVQKMDCTDEAETRMEELTQTAAASTNEPSDEKNMHDVTDDLDLFRTTLSKTIKWPFGSWRFGVPSPKSISLFMRFATKDDIKLPGAEKRSKYYQRHGNPNYEGLVGMISRSKKKRILTETFLSLRQKASGSTDEETSGKVENVPEDEADVRILYDDGTTSVSREKVEPAENVLKRRPEDISEDVDEELEELIGRRKKPFMRMYADDEMAKTMSSRDSSGGGLTITTQSRSALHGRLGIKSSSSSSSQKSSDVRSRLGGRR